MNSPVPRRERIRLATIDEIKQVAREQLAEHGPAGISLRAVARAMGMTPSALYRYVDSRDDLIVALATEAFCSLADALEASFEAAGPADYVGRWRAVTRAYRAWAHEHAVEYRLIFGSPLGSTEMKASEAGSEMRRSIAVLFRCMEEGVKDGVIDPSRFAAQLTPLLRAQFEAWQEHAEVTFPTECMVGCLTTWVHLHGFLTLELFGQLPPFFGDADDIFDQQMLDLLLQLGFRGDGTPPSPPAPHPGPGTSDAAHVPGPGPGPGPAPDADANAAHAPGPGTSGTAQATHPRS